MKKLNVLLLGCAVAVGMSGCIKDGETYDPAAQYEIEKPIISAYALEHGLLDYHDVEGVRVYFDVVETGDPESYQYKAVPSSSNPGQMEIEVPELKVIFSGKLLTGDNVVHKNEKTEGDDMSLVEVPAAAWVYAFLPREIRYDEDGELLDEPIKYRTAGGLTTQGLVAGSKIRFVSPSYLLYANRSSSTIPANSPMVYEIEVVAIEAPEGSN